MYLTTAVLAGYLEEKGIPVRVFGKEPWKFRDIRRYKPDAECDPSFIYCVPQGMPVPDFGGRACVLRALREDAWRDYASEREELVCLCAAETLFETAQECFFLYREWYMTLQEILLRGGDLQQIVESSQSIFHNPIILDDTGFRVLAYTTEYHFGLSDAESSYVVKNGSHTPEYVNLITEHSVFLENLKQNRGPFIYHYEFLEHESVYCAINFENKVVAFLTIVGKNGRLNQKSIDLAQLLANILSSAFRVRGHLLDRNNPNDHILLSFLKGDAINEDVRDICLRKAGIRGGRERYFIGSFFPEKELASNELVAARLYGLLKSKLPGSRLLVDLQTVIVIVNEKFVSRESFLETARKITATYRCLAGMSYSFENVEMMPAYYRQSQCSITLGRRFFRGGAVFSYEQAVQYDLLINAPNKQEKQAAIHPHMLRLREYDAQKNTELLATLKAFLEHRYSSAAAAQVLHVHKNTFYYRLRQISELTGINFENDNLEYLQISLRLLLIQDEL